MKSFFLLFLILITSSAFSQELEFKSLFNGKDLTGWVDVNTSPETWRVENGELICSGLPIGVMRSEKQYENFVLEIEWKHMEAGGNSGIFIWSEGTPFSDEEQLTKAMEVQMLELEWSKINKSDKKAGKSQGKSK